MSADSNRLTLYGLYAEIAEVHGNDAPKSVEKTDKSARSTLFVETMKNIYGRVAVNSLWCQTGCEDDCSVKGVEMVIELLRITKDKNVEDSSVESIKLNFETIGLTEILDKSVAEQKRTEQGITTDYDQLIQLTAGRIIDTLIRFAEKEVKPHVREQVRQQADVAELAKELPIALKERETEITKGDENENYPEIAKTMMAILYAQGKRVKDMSIFANAVAFNIGFSDAGKSKDTKIADAVKYAITADSIENIIDHPSKK